MTGLELQTLFNAIFGLLALLFGWILHTIWAAVQNLQNDDKKIVERLGAIEVLVAGDYVKKDDYRADLGEIKQLLSDINGKIDRKADK